MQKCGSYHISEKVKGSESFEYDKTGEKNNKLME